MKNILVISTSLRKGNSYRLAQQFAKGAEEAGNKVELVSLVGKKIDYCRGCFQCLSKGSCVIKDDAVEIADKMRDADVIAFATPVYYYSMSGQMKTLIDRANCLYSGKRNFTDVYLLATAAEGSPSAMDNTVAGVQGWIDCFSGVSLKGVIRGTGVNDIGDINGKKSLIEAYEMGRNV